MKHTLSYYVKSYAVITLGSLLYALAYNIFYAPNLVAMGGLTGLGQVLNALIPVLPVGTTVFVMNVPLFFLGWKFIGGHLLVSSLYAMTFSSFAIDVMDMIYQFPPMDTMLAAIFGGALLGAGIGLVFAKGATTGGTDLIARLLKLKFAWLPMGTLVLIPDFIVIVLAAIAFGKVESALYGLVSLFITSKVMDMVLYGLDSSKVAYIISDSCKEITDAVIAMDRGATILHGEGAYSGDEKKVLMVAFKQKEIVPLKEKVNEIDPHAFLIVCDAHDVLGEGFRTYSKDDI
ncbi:YitT family protein [Flavonifractor plautii]|uniref:YitT family protein n=1 Tax=Candidatus Flavonifractor intestinigallinarum TaxID=2838586 RepID=A0A9D2MKV2_9FIRM|nr:YitT family protein [Flavonifractor plautii]MBM6665763.1 YitT family protein [Flavonifractor plautii]HJB80017.1 YitT family protein [Candidatus Flavonifractor intestinigallinarum]